MKISKEKQKHDLKTVRWIYSKTAGQRLRLLTLIVINMAGALLSVCFALMCKAVIDSAVNADKNKLILSAVLLFSVILVQILIGILSSALTERTLTNLTISFQDDILATLLKKDYSKIVSYHSGELLNRMFSDVAIVVDGAINLFPSAAYLTFSLIGAAAVLIALSPKFTLLFVAVGLVICAVMMLMRGKLKRLHKQVQDANGQVRSYLQEAVSGLLVVRVFGAENRVREKAKEHQQEYRKARRKRWKISLLGNLGFDFVFEMGYFVALVWGCFGIFGGTLTYGTLAAVLRLISLIQSPFAGFSSIISKFFTVLASAERIMELEDFAEERVKEDIREEVYEKLEAVVFHSVDFTYGRNTVLQDVSAEIPKGSITSVTGISGGGKSTLFLLLLGAYQPTAGKISFKFTDKSEKDISDFGAGGLFAYVPQGNYLFSGTLRENICFLRKDIPEERIYEALRLACADDFVSELPHGLETPLGEKGHGLSEGQMQRIAVARAILSGAPILLLDEATSALDEETEARLLLNIQSLQNRTCIVVTHRKAALKICKKHLVLEDSRIVEKNDN